MRAIDMLYDAIDGLYTQPLWQAAVWVTILNAGMFVAALAVGEVLTRRFKANRVAPMPNALTWTEIWLAGTCVILNALVALIGLVLWREGVIDVRPYGEYSVLTILLDSLVLFVAMDFAMYVFHRAAHHPAVYALAHRSHHVYESPRPLSLFGLNPIEVLGFGGLWLVVITLYTASIEGILAYLAFNLAFGLVAHLGVEPAPRIWVRAPLLRYISTSTFHSEHHLDRFHNYGFYLLVWDQLFGTLSPDYRQDFSRATGAQASTTP